MCSLHTPKKHTQTTTHTMANRCCNSCHISMVPFWPDVITVEDDHGAVCHLCHHILSPHPLVMPAGCCALHRICCCIVMHCPCVLSSSCPLILLATTDYQPIEIFDPLEGIFEGALQPDGVSQSNQPIVNEEHHYLPAHHCELPVCGFLVKDMVVP